jgi:hypothetical protein
MHRTRDGMGDSGAMSMALVPTYDQDTGKVIDVEYIHDARPQISYVMRVGERHGTKLFCTGLVADICNYRNS